MLHRIDSVGAAALFRSLRDADYLVRPAARGTLLDTLTAIQGTLPRAVSEGVGGGLCELSSAFPPPGRVY